MKNKTVDTVGRALSFDEAADSIFVAVKRAGSYKILAVARIITQFFNGVRQRIMILSDGSHYHEDDFDGRVFAV